ncbi:RING finger domain-containing protein [Histoplasma capsulatum G186AR]|uniref:RING finger domain-containing protein n=2 Tax=Ajellomyces capsulatus TaxID=5037 RepID=C0NU57_AJECG|nr:RING finger domain-containing protein [Histoplasma capsulatum G186AR]EEH04937.1 RING finger domain-containing protein [Histoplasma capsulatum G186AR]KAG5287593.1 RING finger domain-containing protein [Histoplasma capsulatum]QSS70593.1 RING finger domain-containing protein [Histoplasma capsulatum G186AR]
MGCSNSTQTGEEPDADRIVAKSLDRYQNSKRVTITILPPDFDLETLETTPQTRAPLPNKLASTADTGVSPNVFAEDELEFDVAMMEIASDIFTAHFGNPDFAAIYDAPGMFEEEKEFDLAMMELSNEIFMGQYGNQDFIAVVYEPETVREVKVVVVEECSICCQSVSEDVILSSPCTSCTSRTCNHCIRKMFISACGDESRMPPRCCGPLNIGAAVPVLTAEELELFKNKHEEWSTANRVYCPVLTCSAFIPYRLFPLEYRPNSTKLAELKLETPSVSLGPTQLQTPPPTPPTSTSLPPPELASIPCPGCSIEICCKCKQLAHKGAQCCEGADELDPELAALLKQWKIKRCPKCRGAVRLMFGCNHVACRCGDQWCWSCTLPIEVCQRNGCFFDGTDYGEEDDDDDDDSDWDEEDNGNENEIGSDERPNQTTPRVRDLDRGGRSRWDDGDHEFGEEPVIHHYDPIDCYHIWIKATTDDVNQSLNYACERCWRDISPWSFLYPEAAELVEYGFISEKSTRDEESQETKLKLFKCNRCSIMLCNDCQAEDTLDKIATRRWEST